jgi:hypothetical protein
MKKFIYFFMTTVIVLFAFIYTGCKKSSSTDSTTGGNPTPMGDVGNTFMGSITGLTNFNAVIKSNTNGISTIGCTGTITDSTMLSLVGLLNSNSLMNINPSTGVFTVDLKAKFTDAGIVDYFSNDGSGSILSSFSEVVGAKYTCKNAEGHTYTREVTAKSTTDDYPYSSLLIKTTTIKETGNFRGIDKVVYRTNHKFGLVNITIYLQDGSFYSFPVYSKKLNQ